MRGYKKVNEGSISTMVSGDYLCYIGHIDTFVVLHFDSETKKFSHPLMDTVVENVTECKLLRQDISSNFDVTEKCAKVGEVISYNGVVLKVEKYPGDCEGCYFRDKHCASVRCLFNGVIYKRVK